MNDVFKPLDRSNVQSRKKPVIVKRVRTLHRDKEGRWVEDRTEGILRNPDGRCAKRFPGVTGEI